MGEQTTHCVQEKNNFCDETKRKIIPWKENILLVAHTVIYVIEGIFPVKYTHGTRISPVTKRVCCRMIFFFESKNIFCDRKFISWAHSNYV